MLNHLTLRAVCNLTAREEAHLSDSRGQEDSCAMLPDEDHAAIASQLEAAGIPFTTDRVPRKDGPVIVYRTDGSTTEPNLEKLAPHVRLLLEVPQFAGFAVLKKDKTRDDGNAWLLSTTLYLNDPRRQ